MDSKHKDIKRRIDDCYHAIKITQEIIKGIRETECKHLEKEKADYMWAPGHISPNTLICSVCGEILFDKIKQGWGELPIITI